jgi:hemerythrin-like domain-containing protein
MTPTTNPITTEPTDAHDMVVVHRVFRRELRLIPELILATPRGALERAVTIAGHARLVLNGLHLHHTSEDDLLWPWLTERAPEAAAVIGRMESQHAVVEDLLGRIEPALRRWEVEARPAVGREVADLLAQLRTPLIEHLDEEEARVLPLIAAYVTPEEWAAVGEAGVAKMTRAELPLMFGAVMEDADDDERRVLLAVLPFPARLLMRIWGGAHYRRYITKVRAAE